MKHHNDNNIKDVDVLQTLCDTLHANIPRATVCVCQASQRENKKQVRWSKQIWGPFRNPFVSSIHTPLSDPGLRCCAPRFLRRLDCIWEEDDNQDKLVPFVLQYAGNQEILPKINDKKQEKQMQDWLEEASDHVDQISFGHQITSQSSSQRTRPHHMSRALDASFSSISSTSSQSTMASMNSMTSASSFSTVASSVFEHQTTKVTLSQVPCELASGHSYYLAIPMSSTQDKKTKVLMVLFPDNEPPSSYEEELVKSSYKLRLSLTPDIKHVSDVKDALRSLQHILRTPLHGMTGMVDQIRDCLDPKNPRDQLIEQHLSSMQFCHQNMEQQIDFFLGGRSYPSSPVDVYEAEDYIATVPAVSSEKNTTEVIKQHRWHVPRMIPHLEKKTIIERSSEKPFRVLAVEDNPINMQIVSRILSQSNVEYTQAWDGQEAIDKFQETKPDLVLLDINLPLMNGFDVAKAIRRVDQRCKIVAMTALCSEADREYGLNECEMDEWYTKPFGAKALRTNLSEWKADWESRQPIPLERQFERSQGILVM